MRLLYFIRRLRRKLLRGCRSGWEGWFPPPPVLKVSTGAARVVTKKLIESAGILS